MLTATLLLCALYALLLVGKAAFALRYIDATRPSAAATAPTTTILQPILGGDPALSDVLESNLRALPWCRFLWLLDTDDNARTQHSRYAACALPADRDRLHATAIGTGRAQS